MGDLIGEAVEGTLYAVTKSEFERVRKLNATATERAAVFADMCRLNALFMIARAGSGHIGSSFSSMDIVAWLLLEELRQGTADAYFSSKGHDAPALYAVMMALGRLPYENLHRLRALGGLPGHPDVGTEGIEANTGSLGMGISKAKGMAFANRQLGRDGRIYVMTGDGELQEGQIWESLATAANNKISEITVIVDHNKLQSDTFVAATSHLGDLEAKFRAFGWRVSRIDGHDLDAFSTALADAKAANDAPTVIIADTIKGCGVSFMQHTALDSDVAMYRFHSGAPDSASYRRAAQEIIDRINKRLDALRMQHLELDTIERPPRPAAGAVQALIPAYSQALVDQAERDPSIVALDADLVLDTGLIAFREKFPDRFVECGIAEMDMVSQAGGMALKGLKPVVHSFACFLSARPNEQIYNNATERTKIVYVGSLAGVIPGGPGHSHQAVRDIAALSGTPGLAMMEPSSPSEVAPLLDWCLNTHDGSSYLRLVSVPWEIPFALPDDYRVIEGRGVALTQGDDAVLFAYGPIMLSEAWHAARLLRERKGPALKVINMPWLNRIDRDWLKQTVGNARSVFTLDNHYIDGGQGDAICAALAEVGLSTGVTVRRLGLTDIPVSGAPGEVLRHHKLDAESLAAAVAAH